jgi:uncharacterized protein with PQ loop repeat
MQWDMANLIGLAGAGLAGIAYLPQIIHLIAEKCSAGISIGAYAIWLIASLFVTASAMMSQSPVFICLGIVQIVATALIFFFSLRYKGQTCPSHRGQSAHN